MYDFDAAYGSGPLHFYKWTRDQIGAGDNEVFYRFGDWARRQRDTKTGELQAIGAVLEAFFLSQNGLYDALARSYALPKLRALPYFERTKVLASDYAKVHALALFRLGQVERSLALLDEAIARLDAPLDLLRRRARILSFAGRSGAALEAMDTLPSARRSPADEAFRAFLLIDLGRAAEVDIEADAEHADLLLAGANAAGLLGRTKEQLELVGRYFAAYDLAPPVLAHGENRFSLGNIEASSSGGAPADVSVIMTCFNAQATIAYAVASVLAQTRSPREVLVVDDASTDETPALLEAMAARDSRIRLLRNGENIGTYQSKNLAARQAEGEFLAFHDADDWWHPQHIEQHLAAVAGARMSLSNWVRIDGEGQFQRNSGGGLLQLNPSSVFLRRAAFLETGGFDDHRYGADTEFIHRARLAWGAASVAHVAKPLALGLKHDRSLTQSGAAGYDQFGYSAEREAYRQKWIAAHRKLVETRRDRK